MYLNFKKAKKLTIRLYINIKFFCKGNKSLKKTLSIAKQNNKELQLTLIIKNKKMRNKVDYIYFSKYFKVLVKFL